MSEPRSADARHAEIAELRAVLAQLLDRHFGTHRQVIALDRRPSATESSFALDNLEVALDDSTSLRLILKDVGPQGMLAAARDAKPSFLYDPLREIEVYQTILAEHHLGTATSYGAVVEPQLERYWLFLEHVPGEELYRVGMPIWQQTARWLARMHQRFGSTATRLPPTGHLLRYDKAFYRTWMERALRFVRRQVEQHDQFQQLDRLAAGYEQVVEQLLALPQTIIHGEFYASNILVQINGGMRVCPVDWEMAALGPALIDLAALTSGAWSDMERTVLAMDYYAELVPCAGWPPSPESFLRLLDLCHLHLAIQWLGWSDSWAPPLEHAHDWLGSALELGKRLLVT